MPAAAALREAGTGCSGFASDPALRAVGPHLQDSALLLEAGPGLLSPLRALRVRGAV
jgi:hypothetical protein